MRRIHILAGIFVAPLLFLAALTRLFYAVTPTAEAWVYRDAMHANPGIDAQSLES